MPKDVTWYDTNWQIHENLEVPFYLIRLEKSMKLWDQKLADAGNECPTVYGSCWLPAAKDAGNQSGSKLSGPVAVA
jgi:hypothetical protein